MNFNNRIYILFGITNLSAKRKLWNDSSVTHKSKESNCSLISWKKSKYSDRLSGLIRISTETLLLSAESISQLEWIGFVRGETLYGKKQSIMFRWKRMHHVSLVRNYGRISMHVDLKYSYPIIHHLKSFNFAIFIHLL